MMELKDEADLTASELSQTVIRQTEDIYRVEDYPP
jgi:hypothetical protein